MERQDDHDNSAVHDNGVFPANVAIRTEVFDARVLFSDEPGGPFVAVTQGQTKEGHSQDIDLSQLTQPDNTQDVAEAQAISVPANPTTTAAAAVPKKTQRKNPTRAKQCLLADKDMFLLEAHRSLSRTAVKSPFYYFLYTKLMYCLYTIPT